MAEEQRDNFTGRFAFMMAAAGSAVGLGNLWRFPYLVDKYGGGMFLLIYIIATFTFGLILFMTEIAVGRRTGKTLIEAYASISAKYKIIGWFGMLIPVLLLPYYCVIGGWVLRYTFSFVSGDVSSFLTFPDSQHYFNDFISGSADGILNGPLIWFLLFIAVTAFVLLRGVSTGLERACKVGMPVLFILLIILASYIVSFPGISPGVWKYFVPDFSEFSMDSALNALSQVFYSMSLASGIMIAFGSYTAKNINIKETTRTTTVIDTIVAIICGLIVVPVVFMSAAEFSSGSGLMFVTLPYVFVHMALGGLIGFLFFALVFFAAWTSAISMGEAMVGGLVDATKIDRKKCTLILVISTAIIGSFISFGYGLLNFIRPLGMSLLDFFDFICGNILLPINAILLCVIIGFAVKPSFVTEEIAINEPLDHPNYYSLMIRYVCPILIVVILVTGIYTKFF